MLLLHNLPQQRTNLSAACRACLGQVVLSNKFSHAPLLHQTRQVWDTGWGRQVGKITRGFGVILNKYNAI